MVLWGALALPKETFLSRQSNREEVRVGDDASRSPTLFFTVTLSINDVLGWVGGKRKDTFAPNPSLDIINKGLTVRSGWRGAKVFFPFAPLPS